MNKKKLKAKRQAQKVRMHVYRSPDKNAPFRKWERITAEPIPDGSNIADDDARRNAKFYYYKLTRILPDGTESEAVDQNTIIQNGRRIERTPETAIMGSYLYWSTDPELPLDEWTKVEELITDGDHRFQSPVKEDFYVYSVSVNFLGEELQRSDVIKVIYKGPV
jgi:hypothetical protein